MFKILTVIHKNFEFSSYDNKKKPNLSVIFHWKKCFPVQKSVYTRTLLAIGKFMRRYLFIQPPCIYVYVYIYIYTGYNTTWKLKLSETPTSPIGEYTPLTGKSGMVLCTIMRVENTIDKGWLTQRLFGFPLTIAFIRFAFTYPNIFFIVSLLRFFMYIINMTTKIKFLSTKLFLNYWNWTNFVTTFVTLWRICFVKFNRESFQIDNSSGFHENF